MNAPVMNLHELQQWMHDALQKEHPEWLGADGESPLLRDYESRFAWLLSRAAPPTETPGPASRVSLAA